MPPLSSNCVPDVEKDDAWSGFVGDMSELRRQSERAVVVRGHVDFCVSNPYCYPKTLCWLDSCRLYNRSSCDQLAHFGCFTDLLFHSSQNEKMGNRK